MPYGCRRGSSVFMSTVVDVDVVVVIRRWPMAAVWE